MAGFDVSIDMENLLAGVSGLDDTADDSKISIEDGRNDEARLEQEAGSLDVPSTPSPLIPRKSPTNDDDVDTRFDDSPQVGAGTLFLL